MTDSSLSFVSFPRRRESITYPIGRLKIPNAHFEITSNGEKQKRDEAFVKLCPVLPDGRKDVFMHFKFSWLLVRQAFITLLVVGISLPPLYALHGYFGWNSPPLWGLVLLGGTLLLAFAGAAFIGILIGQSNSVLRGHRGKKIAVAAIASLLWGAILISAAVPFYTSIVLDQLSHSGTSLIWNEREKLWTRGHQTWQQWRAGKGEAAAEEAARKTAHEALEKSKTLAQDGLATLPALSILLWAIIGTPLIGAWECRRATRFSARF
jgi:hypothetical protein